MALDVFISYASQSRDVAALVARAVEERGHAVWWDRDLLPHDQFATIIEERLDEARCVIVLWSEDARDSKWVRAEANRALDARKLIQANLSQRLPPLPFDQIQTASLVGWQGDTGDSQWQRIAASIEFLISGEVTRLAGPVSGPAAPVRRQAKPFPDWTSLPVQAACAIALAALPVVAALVLLPKELRFLGQPYSPLAIVLVMIALLKLLPDRAARLRLGLLYAGIAGALLSLGAHAALANNFLVSGEFPTGERLLLGCEVSEATCEAIRNNGLACPSPQAMCPLDEDPAEMVLGMNNFEPERIWGAEGMGRVHWWMHLAWNGIFASLAVLVASLLAVPARKP